MARSSGASVDGDLSSRPRWHSTTRSLTTSMRHDTFTALPTLSHRPFSGVRSRVKLAWAGSASPLKENLQQQVARSVASGDVHVKPVSPASRSAAIRSATQVRATPRAPIGASAAAGPSTMAARTTIAAKKAAPTPSSRGSVLAVSNTATLRASVDRSKSRVDTKAGATTKAMGTKSSVKPLANPRPASSAERATISLAARVPLTQRAVPKPFAKPVAVSKGGASLAAEGACNKTPSTARSSAAVSKQTTRAPTSAIQRRAVPVIRPAAASKQAAPVAKQAETKLQTSPVTKVAKNIKEATSVASTQAVQSTKAHQAQKKEILHVHSVAASPLACMTASSDGERQLCLPATSPRIGAAKRALDAPSPLASKRSRPLPSGLSPTSQRRAESRLLHDKALERDVYEWLCAVLPLRAPAAPWDDDALPSLLASGDTLHALLLLVTRACQSNVVVPPLRFPGAAPGSFFARDNIAVFVHVVSKLLAAHGNGCDRVGRGRGGAFEVADVVNGDMAPVARVILQLARGMPRSGGDGGEISALPQSVAFEDEIDMEIKQEEQAIEETAAAEETMATEAADDLAANKVYAAATDDEIDAHVAKLVEERAPWLSSRLTRVRRGTYHLRVGDSQIVKMYVRVLWMQLMVRVGGGWEDMFSFCERRR